MKTDEFAFFNQQLAAMLRDGIPLEGDRPDDQASEAAMEDRKKAGYF